MGARAATAWYSVVPHEMPILIPSRRRSDRLPAAALPTATVVEPGSCSAGTITAWPREKRDSSSRARDHARDGVSRMRISTMPSSRAFFRASETVARESPTREAISCWERPSL